MTLFREEIRARENVRIYHKINDVVEVILSV